MILSTYVISKCKCVAGIAALTISGCCSHNCRMNLGSRSCASSSNADVFWPNICASHILPRFWTCHVGSWGHHVSFKLSKEPAEHNSAVSKVAIWTSSLKFSRGICAFLLWGFVWFCFSLHRERRPLPWSIFCFYTSIWVWLKVGYPIPSIGVSPFAHSNGTFGSMHIGF